MAGLVVLCRQIFFRLVLIVDAQEFCSILEQRLALISPILDGAQGGPAKRCPHAHVLDAGNVYCCKVQCQPA
ncbi:hypothetical protein TYRP_022082 [Tyrophagus putrescentiae]|nr:hypothetical protein TYRP_022082 [Tyrophagus putrescentiae]